MRHFEPDDTTEVTVTLTKKDWAVALEMIADATRRLQDQPLRKSVSGLALDIVGQVKK